VHDSGADASDAAAPYGRSRLMQTQMLDAGAEALFWISVTNAINEKNCARKNKDATGVMRIGKTRQKSSKESQDSSFLIFSAPI
jgi:hypothetical protein